jgi:hypothetical protein
MPRFVTRALRTVHRYNTAPELIDFAILSAINATLCLRSGGNDRVAECQIARVHVVRSLPYSEEVEVCGHRAERDARIHEGARRRRKRPHSRFHNARRRCGRDNYNRPNRMVVGSPTLAVRCRPLRSPTMVEGLKVLFTNVAMIAQSAAEGGSMLVMNVPGGHGHNVCNGS